MAKVLSTKEIVDLQWAIERTLENHGQLVPFHDDTPLDDISTSDGRLVFQLPRRIIAMAYPDLIRLMIRDGYEPLLLQFPEEKDFRNFLMDSGFHCIEGVAPDGKTWPVISHIGVKSTHGVR